jgi:ferredoxin-NADP reductase
MANPIKVRATVESVTDHGNRVYTVSFVSEQRFPRFRPGQFLHMTIDPFDPTSGFWPESRVFSIASRAGAERVVIVYSVKGRYTQRMESFLAPGKDVWLKLPYGDFIVDQSSRTGDDVVLIAGGTGIAPYVPYLEALAENGASGRSVLLVYGVREPALCLFPDLLARCAEGVEGFSLRLFAERIPGDRPSATIPIEHVRSGMLQLDWIVEASRELNSPVYFISGPPRMVDSFKQGLLDLAVPDRRIKIDEW